MKNRLVIITLAVFSIALLIIPITFQSVYADVDIYTNSVSNSGRELGGASSQNKFDGEEVTSTSSLVGKSFDKISIQIRTSGVHAGGAPSDADLVGTFKIGVWDSTSAPTFSNAKVTIATGNADDIVDEPCCVFYTYTFPGYTLQAGDVIGLYFDAVQSSAQKWLSIRFSTSDQFNGTSTRESYYGPNSAPVWNDVPTNDITMILTLTSGSTFAFCSQPENVNLLTCRLLAQGGVFTGPSETIQQGANKIFIQTGLIDGSDTNPKTNGTGYLIVVIALAIMVGIMWVASRGQLTEIPTFIWFIGTIAIVGVFTIADYIDPTFLVITVIVIIGLAVAKIRNVFGGSELFKGES